MPEIVPRSCWTGLTAISQFVGQINGALIQCNEVNLPAWKNLRDYIGNLREGVYCGEEAADSTITPTGENPLRSIQLLANLVIEETETDEGLIISSPADTPAIIQLQRHLLDAVLAMSDYFGTQTIYRDEGPIGEIPNAVWPDRSEEIECLINAGGGLVVTDPKTGEILTNGEAQSRLQTHRDHLSRSATDVRRFRWKAGTPAYVHVTVRNHLEEIRDTLFRMRMDDKPQSQIDEHARALFDDHLDYLQRFWPESSQFTILPRRIRGEKTIFDLINKIGERLQAFRLEDEELINAIHNAEEIAIAKGIQSGDCPLTPGAHVDMAQVSFNVPDEFHDTIRAGLDSPKSRMGEPGIGIGLMYLDIAGIEVKLQHTPDRNIFKVDIHRRTEEAGIGSLQLLKQFIYALRDANPGSAYEVVATDMKRARVYMRAGFEFAPLPGETVDPKTGLPLQEEQRSVRLRLPRVPEAWFFQRSQGLQDVIRRGTSGTGLDVRHPQTGEIISEGEAINLLHYYPDDDTGFFPGDSEWFRYTEESSPEAQDLLYANQSLSRLIDDIDDRLFRGAITSNDKDGAAARLYEEWWSEHAPGGRNQFGSRVYLTLFGLSTTDDPPRWETFPRHVRSYLGLSSLIDKVGQRMDELEQEDEDMLKAIMQAEEEAIRRGTGGTPSAEQVCIPSAYSRWQTALMAARKWATEGWQLVNMPDWPTYEARKKDAEWALGMIDSLLAGDVEERVAELSWETRESGIQRQLRNLLSHLDEWEGEDAEAVKASLRAVVTGESPARCTPSAEQFSIDPYIFLPLYWGARDRGEETFMYEGRDILVSYARYMVEYAGWADITPEDLAAPGAWYDHHTERRQALIEDGNGYDIIDPVSGETIHLDEAEQSLNYLPAPSSRVTAWGGEWFDYAHPQSDNAEFLLQFMDDISDMIYELEGHVVADDPPLGLALDRKASMYYAEWISDKRAYWANYSANIDDSKAVRDLMPDRINSLTQLYQLQEKLLQYRTSLQDADMPMLKAIMLAEAEAMERGWLEQEQNPDAPGAYDPELVDRINANIDRLVSYGLRTEIATAYPSYTLNWSNASGQWFIFYPIHKKGEEVRLDANQILVQASRPAIEEALPLLHMLPLFSQSFEYTHRPPTLEEDDLTPGKIYGLTPEGTEWYETQVEISEAEPHDHEDYIIEMEPPIVEGQEISVYHYPETDWIDRLQTTAGMTDYDKEVMVLGFLSGYFPMDYETLGPAWIETYQPVVDRLIARGYLREFEKGSEPSGYTPSADTPAHEKKYLEGREGRVYPWGTPPQYPPQEVIKQSQDLMDRAEKEIGMDPLMYQDIFDWFLHHPDHTEKELRTQGSHFEKAVGGHSRGGPWYLPHEGKTLPVGASRGATTRHYSDKQLREYFAPVLKWGETARENIPGHPHPRPRIGPYEKGIGVRVRGFTSPPHLTDARARPPIGWEPEPPTPTAFDGVEKYARELQELWA